jgi:sulfur carrier protein
MIKILVNGEITELTENLNLDNVLQRTFSPPQHQVGFAVAVNNDFVCKSQYAATALLEGDSIDVFFPIQGG